ncbi:MAG: hypothetical protein A2133_03190 [Actinobacteria bacterium RBG_16_64_13]|nr:MAG: hypothetical protein A2133_03190 [Actinobacteria bacterium RBG_16_64_13]
MPDEPDAPSENAAGEKPADNPLHKKLGMRPGASGLVIAPPADDDNPLLPLPESFSVLAGFEDLGSAEGPFDYIHVFARDRGELAELFSQLRDKLAPSGSLWISWIKMSADRRSGGIGGDINENIIRRIALTNAMVDVKIAALDRTWSALKVVRRKH